PPSPPATHTLSLHDALPIFGAYLSTFSTAVPTYLYGTLCAGTYTTPAIYVETKAVFTNTVPVDAYRGAGRPEATFVVERMVDLADRKSTRLNSSHQIISYAV